MTIPKQYLLDIWLLFLELSPYLILGFIIAGVLHVFMPKTLFQKHLGKPTMGSILKAAAFGIPLPLCSCGVIPTGISLRQNGASKGATNSFLISTPQTGVDSILITYSLMNIYWAIARPLIALITAILGGWLTEKIDTEASEIEINNTKSATYKSWTLRAKIKRVFSYAFLEFLPDITRPLIIGVLLAAVITNIIPPSLFENYLTIPMLNMVIVLIVSIPLYVCATASVPIATAFLLVGVSPGAVLVFLMAGPATNIATITVLWKSLGKKSTIAYLSAIVIGAFTFGVFIDYALPSELFTTIKTASSKHIHPIGNSIAVASSVLLIALILYVEYKKLFPNTMKISDNQKQYLVEGMSCNHCKTSVEKNVNQIEGITSAVVDLGSKTLVIEGQVKDSEIESKINSLGFEFKGIKS